MKNLAVFLSFVISFFSYSQQANFEATGLAPNFFGYDLENNYHELDSCLSEGKIVVIEFMNVNCGACQNYAPNVGNLYQQYGPNGTNQIELIAIEITNSTDNNDCQNYMNEYNAQYPLINGENSYYYGYEAYSTPTFYIQFSRIRQKLF